MMLAAETGTLAIFLMVGYAVGYLYSLFKAQKDLENMVRVNTNNIADEIWALPKGNKSFAAVWLSLVVDRPKEYAHLEPGLFMLMYTAFVYRKHSSLTREEEELAWKIAKNSISLHIYVHKGVPLFLVDYLLERGYQRLLLSKDTR